MIVAVDICNTLAAVNAEILKLFGPEASAVRDYAGFFGQVGVADKDAWFRAHPEVFAAALPLPGAVSGVVALAAAGHRVVYVSARPLWAEGITRRWLRRHGFPAGRLFLRADKPAVARALGADVFVEDAPHEIEALEKVCRVVPVGQSYNGSNLSWPAVVREVLRSG